jgi:Flp pilus assembly protein TadB
VFWLLRPLVATTPAARPALRRLHPDGVGPPAVRPTPARRWGRRVVGRLWRAPGRELAILRRTTGQYLTSLGTAGLVGFAGVAGCAALLSAAGLRAPVVIPTGAAVAAAALAAWAAHHDLLRRAGRARYEFRRAVCSYLDLVALELAAGHGPVAALERACTGIDGWVFERLRETLLRAQLQLHQPWDQLRRLAAEIDVPELGDVGDIVQAAGSDGAVVHQTLLARAGSLRDQVRVEAIARAKAVTTKLDIPGAVLLLLVAGFAIYPLLARLGGGQ